MIQPAVKRDNLYGTHIIFSTVPHNKLNKQDFEGNLEKHYFKDYRENVDKDNEYPFLYSPLKYYLLGDFDVVYITLINNFKFTHRLFEPKNANSEIFDPHNYQSYSGIALNEEDDLKAIFKPEKNAKRPTSDFVGIINLKLNNGLYIGNGQEFINTVQNKISKLLKGRQYILSQTFAWFELSLIVLIDEPKDLSDIILKLRGLKVKDIESEDKKKIIETSLYYNLNFEKEDVASKIENVSLFSDTNSHLGINEWLINRKYEDEKSPINKKKQKEKPDNYVVEFITEKAKNIKLKTEIEWQVKPGHKHTLLKDITNHSYLKDFFNIGNTQLILGRCDYIIQETDNILPNIHLLRYLSNSRADYCKLFDHIRKVRTYVLFDSDNNPVQNEETEPLSWEKHLEKLAIDTQITSNVEMWLKALKISRQIRITILKIFSNYNNGIQDPIQFIYFLDFRIFIKELIKKIRSDYDNSLNQQLKVRQLEKDYLKYIDEFEEAFEIRFLNGYHFENINDYNLDFNSSMQQLLTSYGTYTYELGKMYFEKDYYPLIQISPSDTTSNFITVNYNSHHLTSPEFIFSSITKEILNNIKSDKEIKEYLVNFNEYYDDLKNWVNESYFDDLIGTNIVDLEYFAIDLIRFQTTFRGLFEPYEMWFWYYIFQNPYNFMSNGTFNEERLRMEMFRLLLIYRTFQKNEEFDLNDLKCPTPEIYNLWHRHYDKINLIVKKIIRYSRQNTNDLLNNFYNTLMEIVRRYNEKLSLSKETKDIEAESRVLLNLHLRENHHQLITLKRNWKNGKPLKNHFPLYQDVLYTLDQTGGVFFYDVNKMQEYNNENIKILQNIFNFSAVQKKHFILKELNP